MVKSFLRRSVFGNASDFPERSAAKPLSDFGKRDSFRVGKA